MIIFDYCNVQNSDDRMRVVLTIYFLLLLYGSMFGQTIDRGVLSHRLQEAIEQHPNAFHHFSILLTDRVDIKMMDQEFYIHHTSNQDRTFQVIHALKEKAKNSQKTILDLLYDSPNVDHHSIRPFWITNVIFVKAKKEMIATLSQRSNIDWMDLNGTLMIDEYKDEIALAPPPAEGIAETGLIAIKAPELWAMGYTGYGRIAMGADTGIDPNHPAIAQNWRALTAPVEESWYDPSNPNNHTPTNCGDHGNHTLGTMLGLDRSRDDTIGVAFNAQWIGADVLCGGGAFSNIASFQWAIDPDNDPSTISDMPDVINNSWWDPGIGEGEDCMSAYVDVLTALETVGIAVVFSAGNDGSGVASITEPKNINTDLVNVFCVANVNGNNPTYPVSESSSRGPSSCGGIESLLIKPEVSAPGVNVRSCQLGLSYGTKTGTSMAAPHVCGAILLLKEAFPYLTGTEIKLALYFNCTDLGEPGEDNTYGMGMIDIKKAFDYLVAEGNEPVSPLVSQDVILVDIGAEKLNCDGNIDFNIKLENAGSTDLSSLDIEYALLSDGNPVFQNVSNWTGNLPSGERITIPINIAEGLEGDFELEVILSNPNGGVDERATNNQMSQLISASNAPPIDVHLLNDLSPCLGANAVLVAESDYENIEYKWFFSPQSTSPIFEGNIYQTPPLAGSLTFYVEGRVTDHIGLESKAEATSSLDINENNGRLVFDAHSSFLLKSVKVYAEDPGSYQVVLLSEDNAVLTSKLVTIEQAGEQRIDLDIFVFEGENLKLGLSTGIGLHHSTQANYPYNIGSVISIKGSNNGSIPVDNYYYFYDWEIEHKHVCGRQAIQVDFQASSSAAKALFDPSSTMVNLNFNGEVLFFNNSENAEKYFWDFGDGTTSIEQHPTHSYTEIGEYQVILLAENADACIDSESVIITVEEASVGIAELEQDQNVKIFPNPTSGLFNLWYSFEHYHTLDLILTDMTGREIAHFPQGVQREGRQLLDLEAYPNGVYFLVCQVNDQKIIKKIIKME